MLCWRQWWLRSHIPPERIGLISLAAGLAIADAISERLVPVSLKWPNDIYLDERKLGGVLIHTRLDATITAMVGIGVNLGSVPESLASSATCLAEILAETPSPRDLAEAIVRRLQARLDQLEAQHVACDKAKTGLPGPSGSRSRSPSRPECPSKVALQASMNSDGC